MNIHWKLRLGFLSALAVLIGTGVLAQFCLRKASNDAGLVAHSYEVLGELQGLSAGSRSVLVAMQRYSVSPSEKQAAEVVANQQQVTSRFRRIRELTYDNPRQLRRLNVLEPGLAPMLGMGPNGFSAKPDNRRAVTEKVLKLDQENAELRQLRAVFLQMTREEDMLLKKRMAAARASSRDAVVLLGAGTLLGALFIGIAGIRMDRELRGREQAEAALRQAHQALEQRVNERTLDLSNALTSLEMEMAERQKIEQELRQSEQRYRVFFEDNPLPMEIFDPETLTYLAVNKAALELYGYKREEFLSMTMKDIRPDDQVPLLLDFLNAVKNKDAYSGTFITKHKSGKLITIRAEARSIQFGERKVWLKLVTDVTEHAQLETRFQQSQKIEAVGRLAGGIAHDFNNLLTVILGYSNTMLHELDESSPLRKQLLEIQAAGQRASNLTRQLLAFSRKQMLKPQVLQLNSVVSGITRMLHRLLGEDIKIVLHLDPDLGQVQADPTQLEQVLVNLAVNARDAMPHGGQLVIESHNIELDERTGPLNGAPAGHYVLLEVSDSGSGMDEETRARVFEPFFTTKEVGKGTGLGLSMVLGVVQQSGGTVTVYSEPGIGTTFKIYLPRLDSAAMLPSPEEKTSQPVTVVTGATILLVEDEPSLRTLARNVLKRAGYNVLEAKDGKEALQVANQLTSAPDLLFTDVIMPEMSGLKLAERLRDKWPDLAVLYTSGYTDHALLDRNELRPDMPFLQKPYLPEAMLEQVARVVAGERPNRPTHHQDAARVEALAV